jgi:hypothetical protein
VHEVEYRAIQANLATLLRSLTSDTETLPQLVDTGLVQAIVAMLLEVEVAVHAQKPTLTNLVAAMVDVARARSTALLKAQVAWHE